jgi:mannose-1-phosphate guanylyltransferase
MSSVIKGLLHLSKRKKECDIMGDLVPYLIEMGEPVGCYSTDAFWYDVGSVERYEKLENGIVEKALGDLFLDGRPTSIEAR